MTIGERLFSIMKEKNISMPELSRMTGISRHTIFDWQRRNTNPGADKIMVICEALQITPEELLIGKRSSASVDHDASVSMDGTEIELVKEYKELSDTKKKTVISIYEYASEYEGENCYGEKCRNNKGCKGKAVG